MVDSAPLKYRAFISYSHADTGWAKWLHRGLESFTIDKDLVGRDTPTGTIPSSMRPIFRDREDFTAGHTLSEQTLAALDASHALIVLCSPAAAKSRYVDEEVRLFRSRQVARPLIPVIVGGKPGDPTLECMPPSLRFKLDGDGLPTSEPSEVLAADAREEGDGKDLALAKVLAGLLGVSSDDIFRRAERERRRQARVRRRIKALFVGLVVLVAAGGVAWLNQDYLKERYYRITQVEPYLLTVEAEHALKAKDAFRECRDCPEMVVVPAGKFLMGSLPSQGFDNEHPQHEVTIGRPFAVSKFEVTFDQWDACVAHGGCTAEAPDAGFGRGTRPVINVSFDDFQDYLAWVSELTGRPYRLLSEAEWEYAARAGASTVYAFGDDPAALGDYAWFVNNSALQTHPVGEKKPNAFGLYDMQGNVREWVEDCDHESYIGAPVDGSAWLGKDCPARIVRNGSWVSLADELTAAHRYGEATDYRVQGYMLGFRVATPLAR